MVDPRTAALESKVLELVEDLAVLKTALSDARWDGVADALQQINQNFQQINARIEQINARLNRIDHAGG